MRTRDREKQRGNTVILSQNDERNRKEKGEEKEEEAAIAKN